MAANNISTLEWKRDRQIAKLELDARKREDQNDARESLPKKKHTGSLATPRYFFYDLSLLPSVYAENDNITRNRVINPNPDGLVDARPWTDSIVEFPIAPQITTVWAENIWTSSTLGFY